MSDLLKSMLGQSVAVDDGTMPTAELVAASPLREVDPASIDILLDRINEHLAAGLPDRITDDDLLKMTLAYRAQAERWAVAEAEKKPRERKARPAVSAVDLDMEL